MSVIQQINIESFSLLLFFPWNSKQNTKIIFCIAYQLGRFKLYNQISEHLFYRLKKYQKLQIAQTLSLPFESYLFCILVEIESKCMNVRILQNLCYLVYWIKSITTILCTEISNFNAVWHACNALLFAFDLLMSSESEVCPFEVFCFLVFFALI